MTAQEAALYHLPQIETFVSAKADMVTSLSINNSDSFDAGDKCLFTNGYRELNSLLPQLRVFGGCCGTDASHTEMSCLSLIVEPGESAISVPEAA
ncbi:MAG: hypothetical protein DWQ10_08810 [Calditrichaeota bacterium]|nr:MAG: hypothetical protein DWQ10_08810 [Calditrichota bacterium]